MVENIFLHRLVLHSGTAKRASLAAIGMVAACIWTPVALAGETLPRPEIAWEVVNRFRLFTSHATFEAYERAAASATQQTGDAGQILATERILAQSSDGMGWLKTENGFCYDRARGLPLASCVRDGIHENYINPVSHPVRLSLANAAQLADAHCVWTLGLGAASSMRSEKCSTVLDLRVKGIRPLHVHVDASLPGDVVTSAEADIAVRDVLIVGMGDSVASGEGNPHVPVALADSGFCYFRFGESLFDPLRFFFAPARKGAAVARACPPNGQGPDERAALDLTRADWLYTPCHRSLYGYQTRTALALAVEDRHRAVTYLPLGCSGATIAEGLLGSQLARERPLAGGKPTPRDVEAQVTQLKPLLLIKKTGRPLRPIDLLLLTVGANDIDFSGLVANVIVQPGAERSLMQRAGLIADPAKSAGLVTKVLTPDFARLRRALQAISPGLLSRTVFTTYPNPSQSAAGAPCPSTSQGFDVHPAFGLDGSRNALVSHFVETIFIPALQALVTCAAGSGCSKPAKNAMTWVDGHRAAFASHGVCAVDAASDPAFDTACFRAQGGSFVATVDGLDRPLACARDSQFQAHQFQAHQFRAYASRARWFRTVNDAYFAAMTYATTLPVLFTPSDIHDAVWGLTDGLYGGAIHPSAEGHAAIADATVVAARESLRKSASAP